MYVHVFGALDFSSTNFSVVGASNDICFNSQVFFLSHSTRKEKQSTRTQKITLMVLIYTYITKCTLHFIRECNVNDGKQPYKKKIVYYFTWPRAIFCRSFTSCICYFCSSSISCAAYMFCWFPVFLWNCRDQWWQFVYVLCVCVKSL